MCSTVVWMVQSNHTKHVDMELNAFKFWSCNFNHLEKCTPSAVDKFKTITSYRSFYRSWREGKCVKENSWFLLIYSCRFGESSLPSTIVIKSMEWRFFPSCATNSHFLLIMPFKSSTPCSPMRPHITSFSTVTSYPRPVYLACWQTYT